MDPFDPNAEFEDLVLDLNDKHRPGSVVSGKARNVLIRAWGLFVGRDRAMRELHAAIERNGSRTALARNLCMSRTTLAEFEAHFASVPDAHTLPKSGKALRDALASLSHSDQVDAAGFAADLLREPRLLQSLRSLQGPNTTRLLEAALRAAELQHAVEKLRQLLESGVTKEKHYQDWCDEHSWAFGSAHRLRDDVRRVNADSIVDLLLPDIVGYRDIVELKRPDANVLKYDKSHKTYYWSADAAKALGQVHKYMDRLHDLAREGLADYPHIVAYHPKATIVIGRSNAWSPRQVDSLRGLNQRLHGIDVITYDHLLMRAEMVLSLVQSPGNSNPRVE